MNSLMNVSSGSTGLLVWLVWALIGVFGAFVAQRYTGGRRTLAFDIIIGGVAAVLGGWLSTQFLGDSAVQLFLLSVLSAVFFAAAALVLVGWLISHFSRDEEDDG